MFSAMFLHFRFNPLKPIRSEYRVKKYWLAGNSCHPIVVAHAMTSSCSTLINQYLKKPVFYSYLNYDTVNINGHMQVVLSEQAAVKDMLHFEGNIFWSFTTVATFFWTIPAFRAVCPEGGPLVDIKSAYLPGTGDTLILKEVLPGRGLTIALRMG